MTGTREEAVQFNREHFLRKAKEMPAWDILVIGGGATGLGVAVDAAHRGYSTLLLEQSDFAKGTSSRSTKLVHGGVRYLAQGDVGLVREALRERGLLLKNAHHLVKKQAFIIPCYSWWSQLKYLSGLKIYDWLSGRGSFGSSSKMNRQEVVNALPGIRTQGLRGGVKYYDGQFDDSRLAVNLAQTCAEEGGVLLNYFKVTALLKGKDGKVSGLSACDEETGQCYEFRARAVVNATGVFVDNILQMDQPSSRHLVRPSQGIHVVLDKSFLNGKDALMIPQTRDGRVLFAVPWHDFALVGTTDTPLDSASLEPQALEKEIDFVLQTAGSYLLRQPTRQDVLSVFAGLRPLAAPEKETSSTKEISRSHKLMISKTGLITITGGKWTTYRQMAEETVNMAIEVSGMDPVPCRTDALKIHGRPAQQQKGIPARKQPADIPATAERNGNPLAEELFSPYGSDASFIRSLVKADPGLGKQLHPQLPYIGAQVVWAVRHEMARSVEDVLARRTRALFLNAQAATEMAPQVACLMAAELKKGAEWEEKQVTDFSRLAAAYRIGEPAVK